MASSKDRKIMIFLSIVGVVLYTLAYAGITLIEYTMIGR